MPEAKNDRTLSRYVLRSERLPIGDRMLSVVLPDARAWMRRGEWVPATVRGAEPPYWVRIWPASVALARTLVRRGGLGGKRLLDLGCGLGIPGITAAREGAVVTFADQEADALAFASWNASRAAPSSSGAPRVEQLDWAQRVLPGPFDVIVLADVTYRALHHVPLLRQVRHALADGGVVVHADPLRRESLAFLSRLGEDLATVSVCRATSFRGQSVDVRLTAAARSPDDLTAWTTAMQPPARREGP